MPQSRQAITSVDTQMSVDFMAYDILYPLDYEYGKNAYYSFTYGPAHYIVLCCYCSIDPDSRQRYWLENSSPLIVPSLMGHGHNAFTHVYHV
jgi:hypothetical protein